MERTKKTSIGTELLVNALRDQGAEIIFGYPGGAALHIYDEFFRQNVNHVLARHEQGAGHMADGYARVAGQVGVAVTTSDRERQILSLRWRQRRWIRCL